MARYIIMPFSDYLKQAESGDAEAQFHVGERYFKGWDVHKNRKKAFEWLKKSAEQGYEPAQNNWMFI